MTKDNGWGSEWPVTPWKEPTEKVDRIGIDWPKAPVFPQQLIAEAKREEKEYTDMYGTEVNTVALGVKPISWPKEATTNSATLKSQGSNLVDEQAYLYFQCEGCQTILDPHTKSFKTLQDKRAEVGWKVKWNLNGQGYKVYCAKCGEKV